jgi:lipoyl(octanoyl) transferase
MVAHGEDFTWSLILPAAEPESRRRPAESYGSLHGALAEALRMTGIHAERVQPTAKPTVGGLCFISPAPGDLLLGGRKIAGAGQRRCRHGLLHQGSVPGDFPAQLAKVLAKEVRAFPEDRLPLEETRRVMEDRYGNEAWLRKR